MRRHLGLSVQEAEEQLPWWEYRMLLEQMLDDRPWINYVVQVEPAEHEEPVSSDLGSLAELGLSVRQVD